VWRCVHRAASKNALEHVEYPFDAIELVAAHEYAHILQYKNDLSPDGPWQMEPHADLGRLNWATHFTTILVTMVSQNLGPLWSALDLMQRSNST
jgi:hypothetical protein